MTFPETLDVTCISVISDLLNFGWFCQAMFKICLLN
jgi:hypothetical protein